MRVTSGQRRMGFDIEGIRQLLCVLNFSADHYMVIFYLACVTVFENAALAKKEYVEMQPIWISFHQGGPTHLFT